MNLAVAHDYLTQRGGAERVVLELVGGFPGAPVFTSLYDPDATFTEFTEVDVRTGPLNRVAAFRADHRRALPVLAAATSLTRIEGFDAVIASSSGWAHGVRTDAPKIVYCYNPARWLYQTEEYLGQHPSRWVRAGLAMSRRPLVAWDRRAAGSADRYVAISTVVRDRIRRAYGIDAEVVAPPPGLDAEGALTPPRAHEGPGGFLLCVSRLLPYKNVGAVISAVNEMPGEHLVVVGCGPERERLTALAGERVTLLGAVSDAELRWLYANCGALVAASYEDFGLTPLEALQFGRPSVVLGAGGFLDTVVDGETGVYFERPEPALIGDAVRRMRSQIWQPDRMSMHVAGFGRDRFRARLRQIVDEVVGGRDAA